MNILTLIIGAIAITSVKCVDYSVEDLTGLFARGMGLTLEQLFNGPTTEPIDNDVTFLLTNR